MALLSARHSETLPSIVIDHFPAHNEVKLHGLLGLQWMYGAVGAKGREVPNITHLPMPRRSHPGEAGRGSRVNQTNELTCTELTFTTNATLWTITNCLLKLIHCGSCVETGTEEAMKKTFMQNFS